MLWPARASITGDDVDLLAELDTVLLEVLSRHGGEALDMVNTDHHGAGR